MIPSKFEFSTANNIIFGPGSIIRITDILKTYGSEVCLIRDQNPFSLSEISPLLNEASIDFIEYVVRSEPNVHTISEAVNIARDYQCKTVVGLGGGSVIDTAKAVSTLLTNDGDLLDYLEVVGRGQKIYHRCAPLIAIPTTAGTGSEVTQNAVIDVPENHVKVSMRSPLMLPWFAIIDPLLTVSLPPELTAYTGMDSFVQVIEPYVSIKANLLTDLFSLEGIKKASRSLIEAFHHGENELARTEMCQVSLLSGLSLANSGVGAVHGFAGIFGGMYHASHGAICASLLPSVFDVNVSALTRRDPSSRALQRYREITQIVTNNTTANLKDGFKWFSDLCKELKIPSLRELGMKIEDIPAIITGAKKSSSMKSNPIELQDDELIEILYKAY